MPTPLKANALSTLGAVKAELDITTSDDDDFIRATINRISNLLEGGDYCNRIFGPFQSVADEAHPSPGGKFMFVDRAPLVTLTSVSYDGTLLDSTQYEIHDASEGTLYSVGGPWINTAAALGNIENDPLPGTERKLYTFSYDGGYVLPKDGVPASVDGTVAENFVFAGEVLTVESDAGLTTITFGSETIDATETCQQVNCAAGARGEQYGDYRCEELTGGYVRIEHTANDATAWLQLGGSAAPVLGLNTDKVYGTRTLPWDLEQLVIEMVVASYDLRGGGRNIESEKLMSYTVKYGAGGAAALTENQKAVIANYKRWM